MMRTLQVRAAALPDAITSAIESVHKTIGLSAGIDVASALYPFSIAVMQGVLQVEAWDADTITSDDVIGRGSIVSPMCSVRETPSEGEKPLSSRSRCCRSAL